MIRGATSDDWPAVWPFVQRIVAAGDTYTWAPDTDEDTLRAYWMAGPPVHTVVAVADDGTGAVLGSARFGPNHGGPGDHVANASLMVDPDAGGRGVGRALAEHVLAQARADGYRAMQFNAVVETNTAAVALWRSLGFEILGTVPQAFRHPTAGLVGLHVMHRFL